jgi:hypothetical protein
MAITEQTRQPQRELTFKDVWAALMENREQMKETDKKFQETDKKFQETDKKFQETAERMRETDKEVKETTRAVKELSRTVGGIDHTQGKLMEEMYSERLWNIFDSLGFAFTQGCRERVFRENGQKIASADIFLENGKYAMPVEVKTKLTIEDVDEHLERIAKIRENMDSHGDKRTLVGAVAGGIAPDNVVTYAQKKGLYVVVWSGDSATVAEASPTFKTREW